MSDPASTTAGPGKFLKNVLGIIFFIVLIVGGILIAVYGARTIPGLFSAGNQASVYTSSIFHPATTTPANTTTTQQPTQTTTNTSPLGSIFANGFNTPILPKASGVIEPGTTGTLGGNTTTATTPTTGSTQTTRVQTGHYVNVPATYYGLPDLVTTIVQVGYLKTSSTNSFVESDSIPSGKDGAVRFIVMNQGNNASGQWRFRAELPSDTDETYDSPYQQSLLPGASVTVILGFDNTDKGNNQDISVIADYGNRIQESNEGNNEDSTTIDIR